MRYVNSTLNAGETIVLGPIRQTKWEYLSFVVLFVVPIFLIWIRRWSTEYAITSRRLVTKVGLLARTGDELRLRRIESVQVQQDLLGRILGYGNVVATGQGNQMVKLLNVIDPIDVKRKLEAAIDSADQTPAPPMVAAG